jgi:hypothetical protein
MTVALVGIAHAQTPCRVLDPEIAGTYVGACENGYANGQGEAVGPQARYQGEFRAGRKHGNGVKRWTHGDVYEGSFVEDRKEGQGTYTWSVTGPAAGERYSGAYRADLRHGYGVYSWPSGDRYSGDWANDTISGPATPGMLARARAEKENEAALARPGARVCKRVKLGISEEQLVFGEVIGRTLSEIDIRIDSPGRFPVTLNGVALTPGSVVRDSLREWTPCR